MIPKSKKPRRSIMTIAVIASIIMLAFAGVTGEFVVVIQNDSPFIMTNVEVDGDGAWAQWIAEVPAGETVSLGVTQKFSESGLGIRFQADGREVTESGIAYLMNGGRGTTAELIVTEELEVEATHHDRPSWHWRRIM